MAKETIIKPGDKCLDPNCNGKLILALICDDDTCGGTIHPADGYRIQIPGQLNKIQIDLLTSFIIGHWKEISKSEHKVAFERILGALNPSALQVVNAVR